MSWEHKGYNIGVDQNGLFIATVGEENLRHSSLEGLKGLIDAESQRKIRVVNIPVVGVLSYDGYSLATKKSPESRDGEIIRATVTGIHRVSGRVLCKSGQIPKNHSLLWVVPDTPEAVKLLLRCKEIQKLQEKAKALLQEYRIDGVTGHFGRIAAADYDKKLDEMLDKANKSSTFTLGDKLIDRISMVDTMVDIWAAGLRKDGEGKK